MLLEERDTLRLGEMGQRLAHRLPHTPVRSLGHREDRFHDGIHLVQKVGNATEFGQDMELHVRKFVVEESFEQGFEFL